MNAHAMAPVAGPDYTPLDQALGQLREHNSGLERFIDQLLDEVTSLGHEVENRASELTRVRQQLEQSSQSTDQLAEENSRLAIQVQQRSDALSQAHAEIERLRQQLEVASSQSAETAAHDVQLRAQQNQIEELNQALMSARAQAENQQQDEAELEQLRQELAATKLELLKRSQEPQNEHQDADLESLVEKNQALEGELHQARGHAMRLTQTIDQQRKELNQQKSVWTEELQSMRSLLERRSVPPADRTQGASFADTSVISDTATVSRDELEVRANNNNTVVDSVMAQFAKLQRDVNKRRSQRR